MDFGINLSKIGDDFYVNRIKINESTYIKLQNELNKILIESIQGINTESRIKNLNNMINSLSQENFNINELIIYKEFMEFDDQYLFIFELRDIEIASAKYDINQKKLLLKLDDYLINFNIQKKINREVENVTSKYVNRILSVTLNKKLNN